MDDPDRRHERHRAQALGVAQHRAAHIGRGSVRAGIDVEQVTGGVDDGVAEAVEHEDAVRAGVGMADPERADRPRHPVAMRAGKDLGGLHGIDRGASRERSRVQADRAGGDGPQGGAVRAVLDADVDGSGRGAGRDRRVARLAGEQMHVVRRGGAGGELALGPHE